MGNCSKTQEQKCDWFKMSLHKQNKLIWKCDRKQSEDSVKRISQVESIEFEETFALVAKMEAMKMLLAYAFSKRIKVYKMDVNLYFVNGDLEEVYIEQPKGFLLSKGEGYVCRLNKALYGLKKASRAWYSIFGRYMQQQGFKKENVDNNL